MLDIVCNIEGNVFFNIRNVSVLVSSDKLGGEAAKTCSYGVELHLFDALIRATEKIVRSKQAHFSALQVDALEIPHWF